MKLTKPFRILSNILFPGQCVFCDKMLEPNALRNVCPQCEELIGTSRKRLCCVKCGKPVASYGKRKICYFCYDNPTKYFDRIVSAFEYDDLVKESVLRYKLGVIPAYAVTYADFLAETVKEHYDGIEFDFICGAPSHTNKKVSQGFDNVELICKYLSKSLDIPLEKNLIKKIRNTPRQSSLKYSERQENLKNSMTIPNCQKVRGKTVLLVDDVCTTRATMIECSRALKQAGAKRVYGVTFATTGYKRKIMLGQKEKMI